MDFESLKQSSSNFDAITKPGNKTFQEDQSNKNKYQDDRLWKPELDKTGNGYAVIRFCLTLMAKKCMAKSMVTCFFKTKVVGILRTH